MSDNDIHRAFLDRAAVLLHHAVLCIRNCSQSPGQERMVGDLADAIHNLPEMFYRWNDFEYRNTRNSLEWFEKKHFGEVGRFSSCLDLSEEELDTYRRRETGISPGQESNLEMAASAAS